MQCVILAGGLGTRLSGVSGSVPKTLMPVGGRPFAEHQLMWLANGGITEVVYCIGYGGGQIRSHVGEGQRFGLDISYVDEGSQLRGTGGALRLALEEGVLQESFFVLYGDSLLDLNLRDVRNRYRASECAGLMTVYRNGGQFARSNAAFDGAVVTYDKRNPTADMEWIDYGLMVLSHAAIAGVAPDTVVDLCDVLKDLSDRGDLAGFEAEVRFFEIGTPEALAELEDAMTEARKPRR